MLRHTQIILLSLCLIVCATLLSTSLGVKARAHGVARAERMNSLYSLTPTSMLPPPPACTPTWRNEPPLTNARRNAAVAVVGSNLYAITGFNAAPDYTDVNERFDGTSWTTMVPIPNKLA